MPDRLTKTKISVRPPEEAWVRSVSTDYPETVFRVLSALPGDDYGVGVVEIEAESKEELVSVLESVRGHGAVREADELWTDGETRSLVRFETGSPLMLQMAHGSGVPIEMPFEIRDGTLTWELTAPRDRISELCSVFDSMGVEYSVDYVRKVEQEELLTDKQLHVIETALEMGYYDTPREASMSEVADSLGIAKSTCSETLHRAEESVIKRFFD